MSDPPSKPSDRLPGGNTGLGIALGTAFDNIAIGIGVGVAIGLAIRSGLDRRGDG
jgi:hypothetical protein